MRLKGEVEEDLEGEGKVVDIEGEEVEYRVLL